MAVIGTTASLIAVILVVQVAVIQSWDENDIVFAAPQDEAVDAPVARDFPHQATVVIYRSPTDIQLCGGSLIARQWVLTSAACLNKCAHGANDPADCNDFFRVVLGAQQLRREEPEQEGHTVVKVIEHPDYQGDVANDLALLQLDSPANLSDYIQPVKLSAESKLHKLPLLVSGWGSVLEENLNNLTLRSTPLSTSLFGNLVCRVVFMRHKLKSHHYCGRQQSCVADRGGSPVVVRSVSGGRTQTVQLGLSSGAVSKQCHRVFPALFVRVDLFLDWIRSVTGVQV